jgi:hypothetical protein
VSEQPAKQPLTAPHHDAHDERMHAGTDAPVQTCRIWSSGRAESKPSKSAVEPAAELPFQSQKQSKWYLPSRWKMVRTRGGDEGYVLEESPSEGEVGRWGGGGGRGGRHRHRRLPFGLNPIELWVPHQPGDSELILRDLVFALLHTAKECRHSRETQPYQHRKDKAIVRKKASRLKGSVDPHKVRMHSVQMGESTQHTQHVQRCGRTSSIPCVVGGVTQKTLNATQPTFTKEREETLERGGMTHLACRTVRLGILDSSCNPHPHPSRHVSLLTHNMSSYQECIPGRHTETTTHRANPYTCNIHTSQRTPPLGALSLAG